MAPSENHNLEIWKSICFILYSNIKKEIDEKIFQKDVIRALERLGWDQYRGEIEEKPSIQVGSYRKIEPDIIIRSAENKQTHFVIEVKKPSVDISKPEIIDQLKSYMRQIKCELGLVIGNQINIYWDDRNSGHDEFVSLAQISFDEKDAGEEFVQAFSKEGVLAKKHQAYIIEKVKAIKELETCDKIRNYLISDEFKEKLLDQIRMEVCQTLSETNRNRILEDLSLNIHYKSQSIENYSISDTNTLQVENDLSNSTIFHKSKNERDYTKYRFNGTVYNKRNLALAIIKKYVNDHPGITFSQLESVFQKHNFSGHHQSSNGVFSKIEFARTSDPKRFFLESDEILKLSDSTIAVSNQWGIENISILIDIVKKAGFVISRIDEQA